MHNVQYILCSMYCMLCQYFLFNLSYVMTFHVVWSYTVNILFHFWLEICCLCYSEKIIYCCFSEKILHDCFSETILYDCFSEKILYDCFSEMTLLYDCFLKDIILFFFFWKNILWLAIAFLKRPYIWMLSKNLLYM